MISDFMTDDNYEQTLKIAGKKHDLTGIRVYDAREEKMPNIGMVNMLDAETGETLLVDTGSKSVRMEYENTIKIRLNISKKLLAKVAQAL